MADPRLTVDTLVGIKPTRQTFRADGTDIVYSATAPGGSVVVGRAVMQSAANVCRLTGAGARVLGMLEKVEPDGRCTVHTAGVVQLPKGDSAIAFDDAIVGDTLAGARGYIRGVVKATLADVAVGAHRVINVADTTKCEVELIAS